MFFTFTSLVILLLVLRILLLATHGLCVSISIGSLVSILDAAIFFALVCVVLDNLGEHSGNLLLKQHPELVFHIVGEPVLLAELLGQALRRVTFVNDNALHALLANVDVDVEFGIHGLLWCSILLTVGVLFVWIILLNIVGALVVLLMVLVVRHVLPQLLIDEHA